MVSYIYQLPARVLDDLCRNMDTLSEWDWMQFASYVVTDLTQLRRIKSMERVQGASITRELLWWWGMRQATVQQLVDLLCHLELYRAAQIVLSWSLPTQSLVPPSKDEAPHSLKTNLPASSDSKDSSTSVPKQEELLSLPGDNLFWSEADVAQATNDFDQNQRISEGTFADLYQGQRCGVPFVVKKFREVACSRPGSLERFFQAEVQICLRCCHPNILPLLGFCTGRQLHSLIHPYMVNGSLQDRLQAQDGPEPLPWLRRVSICAGLVHAVEHLHSLEIIHGNVKSSNVLLDENFTPKLAHPMSHLCPVSGRTQYTMRKTHIFQASVAYLPEDFIRVGQLTKRVDVFSCGIVLAEVLTGIAAMDTSRSPVYLKDLLLREIPSSTTLSCPRKRGMEKVMAKEICHKYLEKRSGMLPEDCAEALATVVCLCLCKRDTSLEKARETMAAVEERLRGSESLLPWSGLTAGSGSSSNTPEETDDVDNSSLHSAASAPHGATAPPFATGACAALRPPRDATETSWKIEINDAKRKLMADILLYKEEKLDSIELFGP
ncbi:interleukin-1 receptor-associated kinase-like 2 [Ctenodactylus gundi]